MKKIEQLRILAAMVEDTTDGKQQFTGDMEGGVQIIPAKNSVTGLHMRRVHDRENDSSHLRFQGYICGTDEYMSAVQCRQVAVEMQRIANLLDTLEREPVLVEDRDMVQWSEELTALQVDCAIARATGPDPQLDLTMGGV